MIDYETIPQPAIDALARYVFDGIRPGGFLQAILSNDLFRAVGHGTNITFDGLHSIVGFINNEIPTKAWGSLEAVEAWLTMASGEQRGSSAWCVKLRELAGYEEPDAAK